MACLVGILSAVAADVPEHLKTVGDTFKNTIRDNEVVVVMFYASWCSISKRLQDPFDELYRELAPQGVVLAKVNTIDEPDLYWQFDIKGFPTFILFKDGEQLLFEGEPEIADIKEFIEKNAANSVAHLNPQVFYDLDMTAQPLAVEFFEEGARPDASSAFDFACKKFKFPHCFASTSKEFADMLGVPIPSHVIIKEYAATHNPVTEAIAFTTDEFADSTGLLAWMKDNAFPPLVEHSEKNQQLIFFNQRPGFQTHAILFVKDKKSPANRALLDTYEEVAKEFMNRLVFTFADGSAPTDRVEDLMVDTEVTEDSFPTIVVIHSATKSIKFFKLEPGAELTSESMSEWLNKFFKKELDHFKLIGEE
jgi:thiol-disulfide isomerase/thioredoxin